jgi:phosphoribosylglycinamide formyltransferase-1
MRERFVSEAIEPLIETCDAARLAVGEPGLPRRFRWRGQNVEVTGVLRTWRETGPCRHGSGERYVRKHWFEVATASGATMRLYSERRPLHGRKDSRWWLYSVCEPAA